MTFFGDKIGSCSSEGEDENMGASLQVWIVVVNFSRARGLLDLREHKLRRQIVT